MRSIAIPLLSISLSVAGCGASHSTNTCPTSARPPARSDFDAILTPDTNSIYVFGGDSNKNAVPDNDLWRYPLDGSCVSWQQLSPSTASPKARGSYAAALDATRNRIIYVGGLDNDGNGLIDSWALDTDALQFSQLLTVGTMPLPRGGRAAAYDSMADRLLLLGDLAYQLDFSGSDQGVWSAISAGGDTPPSARLDFASAVDPTRSFVLMFGGNVDFDGMTNELWAFDFLLNSWHIIASTGDVPTARAGARMQWDAQDKILLVFGGSDANGAQNDLYSVQLDGNGVNAIWTRVSRAGTQPPARSDFDMVISGDLLWLFGGSGACGQLDDVWTLPLDGGSWSDVMAQSHC